MTQPGQIPSSSLSQVVLHLRPERLVPGLTAGLVTGILQVTIAITLGAFIFAGDLSGFVARGVGVALMGTVIAGLLLALLSSLPGVVFTIQDAPAAILAVITTGILRSFPADIPADERFATVAAAIALSTLLTGLSFFGLGYFRLGNLVRFLPYPVIGGFLAGTGWLLVIGGMGLMVDISIELAQLPLFFQPALVVRWLPGLVYAFVMLAILQRYQHYLLLPGLILGGIVLFFLVTWLSGLSPAQLSAQGWLLGPISQGGLWQPIAPSDLAGVQWRAIWQQAPNMATIAIVSTVALLLNAGALEVTAHQDMELNHELRAAGISNLASGLAGGIVGFHSLSLSVLNIKLAHGNRLPGLVAMAFCSLVLLFGASILSFFPKVILGGLLVFLGLSFLIDWAYHSWFRLPRIDYLMVLLIVVVIATIGYLPGVAVGLVLAVAIFVVNYSRIDVVKHALSGGFMRSRVTRCSDEQQILTERGEEVTILQLQGFIFFGTADNLLAQVQRRLADPDLPPLRYLLLDFRRVTSVDSTAMLSFNKMQQLLERHQIILVLTGLTPGIRKHFATGDFDLSHPNVHLFPDLDRGLEWCETRLLQLAGEEPHSSYRPLSEEFSALLGESAGISHLINYFERREVDKGYYLIQQGDPPDDLYFIESGQVTAQLEDPDGEPIRLQTMRGGHVVGEVGFYLGQQRTAAVVVDEPTVVYCLSQRTLQMLEKSDPAAASLLHQLIINLLARRVVHLVRAVDALQR